MNGLDENSARPPSEADESERVSPTTPRFVVVEGLSCTGKSTIAPLLADALGGCFLPTLTDELERTRKYVDATCTPASRVHFWMLANYVASSRVGLELEAGNSVVVESYFFRTLATHAAMGVCPLPTINWMDALFPDLTVMLTVDEGVRQQRLRERKQRHGLSRWSEIEEANVERTRHIYQSFGLQQLDTTLYQPQQVVREVAEMVEEIGVEDV